LANRGLLWVGAHTSNWVMPVLTESVLFVGLGTVLFSWLAGITMGFSMNFTSVFMMMKAFWLLADLSQGKSKGIRDSFLISILTLLSYSAALKFLGDDSFSIPFFLELVALPHAIYNGLISNREFMQGRLLGMSIIGKSGGRADGLVFKRRLAAYGIQTDHLGSLFQPPVEDPEQARRRFEYFASGINKAIEDWNKHQQRSSRGLSKVMIGYRLRYGSA
jgi:hypothetical protein